LQRQWSYQSDGSWGVDHGDPARRDDDANGGGTNGGMEWEDDSAR